MKETFDMIKKFSKDYELRLSSGTLRNYVYDLNCFFNYVQKGYETIKSSDVREWLKNMMNDGLKPSTIKNKICCLKSFFLPLPSISTTNT
ncbi:MAG: site-specific integrase, partial [Acholeplasmataceae bacterium]|nr:site-specific integrase [Acholeplasmataceae bacterium]